MPFGSHVERWSFVIWTTVLHPGGASGVLLKSNAPLSCAYTNSLGLIFDGRSKFNVMVAWSMRRHHRCIGKSGGKLESPAMK